VIVLRIGLTGATVPVIYLFLSFETRCGHVAMVQIEPRFGRCGGRAGCDRLGLDPPVEGETRLFSQTFGWRWLGEWRIRPVFDLTTGQSRFDN